MKGDFSRNTFDRSKHYSSVRRQQGRVDVDADWNEQADIAHYRRRTTSTDVIGPSGGPAGVDVQGNPLAGFEIVGPGGTLGDPEFTVSGDDLGISPGRFYVDGILVENEAATTLRAQPDLAEADGADSTDYFDPDGAVPGTYVAYLDVWERHETHLDDDAMREVALNGPDTATRTRVVWQVKLQQVSDSGDPLPCADLVPGWAPSGEVRTPGTLAARAEPDPAAKGPCIVPAGAGYRGLENQLYRVEVHDAGDENAATFKWSRENGAVVTRCDTWNEASLTVIVSPVPHVGPLGFAAGDWVELINDAAELRGEPGLLVELADAEGDRLVLEGAPATDPTGFKVRRWEMRKGDDEATFVKADGDGSGGWIALEDGVQVQVGTGDYRTGDYWLVPARTATGDVEWPVDGTSPRVLPPEGIAHHYAPLAVLQWDGTAFGADVDDRRHLFPPLTALARRTCCTVTVGNGETSCGDFNDLGAALDWAQAWQAHHEGAPTTICLLSGVHTLAATVILDDRHDLIIHGCGPGTRLVGPANWAFRVRRCTGVRIDSLALDLGAGRRGIQVANKTGPIALTDLTIHGGATGIDLADCHDVTVAGCTLTGGPLQGDGLIVGAASGVRVADCTVQRAHANGAIRISAKANGVEVTGCTLAGDAKQEKGSVGPGLVVAGARDVVARGGTLSGVPAAALQGSGIALSDNRIVGAGVYVLDGSEAVTVQRNTIGPGKGPGVVLSGPPIDADAAARAVGVVGVDVRGNRISGMSGSGIRTDPGMAKAKWGEVEGVRIAGNRIQGCASAPGTEEPEVAGVALEAAVDLTISDNLIQENRREDGGPVSGIVVNGCENLAVTGNRVAFNGAERLADGAWQAGVAILNVTDTDTESGGGPAAVIHGNTVSCPCGQALLLFGDGGVSVADNDLQARSRPLDPATGATGPVGPLQAGQCVLILDIHRGLFHALAVSGVLRTNYHFGDGKAARSLPREAVLFHGNRLSQEVVASAGAPGIATLVMGTGDVAVADNQFQCERAAGAPLADLLVLAATIRVRGNRLTEPPYALWLSALTYGLLGNITADNQADHCVLPLGGNVVSRDNQMLLFDCLRDKQVSAMASPVAHL